MIKFPHEEEGLDMLYKIFVIVQFCWWKTEHVNFYKLALNYSLWISQTVCLTQFSNNQWLFHSHLDSNLNKLILSETNPCMESPSQIHPRAMMNGYHRSPIMGWHRDFHDFHREILLKKCSWCPYRSSLFLAMSCFKYFYEFTAYPEHIVPTLALTQIHLAFMPLLWAKAIRWRFWWIWVH